MTIILTISTIIMTTLFFVACYLLNEAIEKGVEMEGNLQAINDAHTLSNNYWMIEEQKRIHMQKQLKKYMKTVDAIIKESN